MPGIRRRNLPRRYGDTESRTKHPEILICSEVVFDFSSFLRHLRSCHPERSLGSRSESKRSRRTPYLRTPPETRQGIFGRCGSVRMPCGVKGCVGGQGILRLGLKPSLRMTVLSG